MRRRRGATSASGFDGVLAWNRDATGLVGLLDLTNREFTEDQPELAVDMVAVKKHLAREAAAG